MMVSTISPSEGVLNSATFISVTHVLGYNIVTFGIVLHTLVSVLHNHVKRSWVMMFSTGAISVAKTSSVLLVTGLVLSVFRL